MIYNFNRIAYGADKNILLLYDAVFYRKNTTLSDEFALFLNHIAFNFFILIRSNKLFILFENERFFPLKYLITESIVFISPLL